jgi:hypothetical protein
MSYAVRHRFIDYNPVRNAERLKDQGEEEKPSIIKLGTPGRIRTCGLRIRRARF